MAVITTSGHTARKRAKPNMIGLRLNGWPDMKVLGPYGRYSGPPIFNKLERYHLCAVHPHPSDGRRRLYRGIGNFNCVNWSKQLNDAAQAHARFDRLKKLVRLPESDIPATIDQYFGDEMQHKIEDT